MLRSYSKDKNQKKDMKDAVMFVKQKIDSAKWFIDAIRQRQNTLLLTMNAILEYQQEYFIDGDETRLKPMILKDVAEMTGLDISTVSRVANTANSFKPTSVFFRLSFSSPKDCKPIAVKKFRHGRLKESCRIL